jgi:hypothetical protein
MLGQFSKRLAKNIVGEKRLDFELLLPIDQ